MVSIRTLHMIERLPSNLRAQVLEVVKRRKARREAADQNRALDFLCSVEVRESDFAEWEDTMATFAAR